MHIQLKVTKDDTLVHKMIDELNRYLVGITDDDPYIFHSGSNGLVFSFTFESDDFTANIMITKNRISISNFIMKNLPTWSNIGINISSELEHVVFNDNLFHSTLDLHSYLKETLVDNGNTEIHPLTYLFEINHSESDKLSEEDSDVLDFVNSSIRNGVKNKSTYYRKEIHVYGVANNTVTSVETIYIFDENHDTEIKLTRNGHVFVESSENGIRAHIKLNSVEENILAPAVRLLPDKLISFNDLWNMLSSV